MPVESLPTRGGALWLENWILASTIASVTNAHANYPAKNLLSPHRSDTWQSTDVGDRSIVFDMGELKVPECCALIESNIDGGAFFRLRGSDDSAQVIQPVYWDLPLYTQDVVGKVLKWYLGDPTSGTLGSGRRFWGVRLLPSTFGSYNTPDPWFEIGVPWLGEYVPIIPWEGIRPRPRDPSTRTRAYGQAQWSDLLHPAREVDVPLAGLTLSEWYALEAKIRAQGPKHAIIDLHAFSSDVILKRGGALYGYFAEDPLDGDIGSPENNSMRLRFEEASG